MPFRGPFGSPKSRGNGVSAFFGAGDLESKLSYWGRGLGCLHNFQYGTI
jgi:hypothetical protein